MATVLSQALEDARREFVTEDQILRLMPLIDRFLDQIRD
jgi:hypothetical protein